MAGSKDRRKESRMGLVLPVRVQGNTGAGEWTEMAQSDDASFGGCSFTLKHGVERGHCLLLSLPLPKAFRRYDWTVPSYQVYALVRTADSVPEGIRVGVMFFGKTPPRGYTENPKSRFLLPNDPKPAGQERRKGRRLSIFVNLKLIREGGDGPGPHQEQTVAENLGKGGARVMTSLAVTKGEILVVEEVGGSFRTRAEIRNVYIGKDNVPRLNLHFLDGETPDRLISAGA